MNTRTKCTLMLIALLLSLPGIVCLGQEQYKKLARDSMADIVDGRYNAAIRQGAGYLAEQPGDLESLYTLAVAHAQDGQIAEALSYVTRAVEAGLPFGRFLAGPRDLLEPLTQSAGFKALAAEHGALLLHGPMISVTDTEARCWGRTAQEAQVLFRAWETGTGPSDEGGRACLGRTDQMRDFTTVLTLGGLKPDTQYDYVFQVTTEDTKCTGRFRTFPPKGQAARFQIGFGGGAGYTPKYERMWNTVAARELTAFLFLGDNVYIDHPTRQAVQQYCYYRRQSRPEYRRFVAGTPIFAIWDDHDFTINDGWGGPYIHEPAWKVPVFRTFMNNWNNPSYGGGATQPGCWFQLAIGDVDVFMLDGRYYRQKGRRQGLEVTSPSMLGAAQKQWLLAALRDSKATFKVLASPVPWSPGAKPGRAGMDTWEGFHEEREEIFSFLEKQKIDGVILISADRHRSDAWKNERASGYPLYEFESSRLTNIHTHGIMPGSLYGYNEKCSFGMLAFDTVAADPTVTYRIVNIDNDVLYTLELKKSQLTHQR